MARVGAVALVMVVVVAGAVGETSARPAVRGSEEEPTARLMSSVGLEPSVGKAFYVSANGSDTAAGTSPITAWKTLARANRHRFRPGQRLLLAGGETFVGPLSFPAGEAGTAGSPITVSTYGSGRATISIAGSSTSAISIHAGGYDVSNLDLVGPGASVYVSGPGRMASTAAGLWLYTAAPGHRSNIHIADLSSRGFYQGVGIGAAGRSAGFGNVTLAAVDATDNADAGIETFGDHAGSIDDITIVDSVASGNPGVPGKTPSTGNGIVLGDVADAVVQRCVTAENGRLDLSTSVKGAVTGPAGLWAYDSTKVTFLQDESYNNDTGNHADGDGFDLDLGVTDSTMEYDYSYGNAGAGYLLDGSTAQPNRGNTVRYNISDYDGWDADHGGLELVGTVTGAELYNNTVDSIPFRQTGGYPEAVSVYGAKAQAAFRNNLLVDSGGLSLISVPETSRGLVFEGNDYWSGGARLTILWGRSTFHTLTGWRAETGEERLSGHATGEAVAPRFVNSGGSGTVSDAAQLSRLDGLKLGPKSTLAAAGVNLTGDKIGLSVGNMDFWGDPLMSSGIFSIGADQPRVVRKAKHASRDFLVAAWDVAAAGIVASALQTRRRRRQAA